MCVKHGFTPMLLPEDPCKCNSGTKYFLFGDIERATTLVDNYPRTPFFKLSIADFLCQAGFAVQHYCQVATPGSLLSASHKIPWIVTENHIRGILQGLRLGLWNTLSLDFLLRAHCFSEVDSGRHRSARQLGKSSFREVDARKGFWSDMTLTIQPCFLSRDLLTSDFHSFGAAPVPRYVRSRYCT